MSESSRAGDDVRAAYVPPHRRRARATAQEASSFKPTAEEGSSFTLPTTHLHDESASQANTSLSAKPPPLVYHPEGVPSRVVSLEQLRVSSKQPHHALPDISPDDSISVVAEGLADEKVPLEALTEHQVARVLSSIGLGKYAEACISVPLRGQDLAFCTDEDLKEIGISFRPHRLSLLEEVSRMKAAEMIRLL